MKSELIFQLQPPMLSSTREANRMGHSTYIVRRPSQIQALATPTRLEIVEMLQVHGAASISEIAESLGRRPDSLYYHVRILQKVGLLQETAKRPRNRTYEAVYDLPGRPLKIDYRLSDRRIRKGLVRLISSLLRNTARDFHRAVESRPLVAEGPCRQLWGARLKGRVTRSQLREINAHLHRIGEILTTPTAAHPNAELMAATFVVLPLNRESTKNEGLRSPARSRTRDPGEPIPGGRGSARPGFLRAIPGGPLHRRRPGRFRMARRC
ncbi:MAG: helix-turn-helix domain-containing protein, partial [Candidatus Eisenbacteria bacterium]|nr:helix-turn-helix domain-containing protein [Candidatus Latescibacterota bacterium]MBD3302531.1 helix-turn-helix domain-containing protein [Candidatus Eisenbacteria bacterium]